MNVVNKEPVRGAKMKEEIPRETVSIRVDARTVIEVSANLTPEQRRKRVEDFIKNRGQRLGQIS